MYFVNSSFQYSNLDFGHISKFYAPQSYLADVNVCSWLKNANELKYLSLTTSEIHSVEQKCFSNNQQMIFIEMTGNHLARIVHHVFSSLPHLTKINISSNPIETVSRGAFENLPKLQVISVLNTTSHITVHYELFHGLNLKMLETNTTFLCCLLSSNAQCSLVVPLHISCAHLLESAPLRTACAVTAFAILLCNVLSVTLQKYPCSKKLKVFEITVLLVGASQMPLAAPLLILWIQDLIYSASYPIFQDTWQSSATCFVVFTLFVHNKIESLTTSLFLATARLMIVKFPMKTKFKQTNFYQREAVKCATVSTLLSCLVTFLTWLVSFQMLGSLQLSAICSPLCDPTRKMILIKIIIWILSVSQFLSIVCVISFYIDLLRTLHKSQKIIKSGSNMEQTNAVMKAQLLIFTSSDILSSVLPNFLFLSSIYLKEYPVLVIFWTVITICSIKSVLHPAVYTALTLRSNVKSKEQTGQPTVVKFVQRPDTARQAEEKDAKK